MSFFFFFHSAIRRHQRRTPAARQEKNEPQKCQSRIRTSPDPPWRLHKQIAKNKPIDINNRYAGPLSGSLVVLAAQGQRAYPLLFRATRYRRLLILSFRCVAPVKPSAEPGRGHRWDHPALVEQSGGAVEQGKKRRRRNRNSVQVQGRRDVADCVRRNDWKRVTVRPACPGISVENNGASRCRK